MDYDLNKLNKKELLELLLQQIGENESMQEKLKTMEAKVEEIQKDCESRLEERRIEISRAGTMAEAAMRLNKVFIDADLAVKQYHENIKRYSMDAEAMAASMKEGVERKTGEMLALAKEEIECEKGRARILVQATIENSRQEAAKIVADGRNESEKIIADAKKEAADIRLEAENYKKEIQSKMTDFYSTFKGLQSIMGGIGDNT